MERTFPLIAIALGWYPSISKAPSTVSINWALFVGAAFMGVAAAFLYSGKPDWSYANLIERTIKKDVFSLDHVLTLSVAALFRGQFSAPLCAIVSKSISRH